MGSILPLVLAMDVSPRLVAVICAFPPPLSPMSHISFFPVEAASFQLISKIPVEIFLDIFIVSEGSRPSKCPTDPFTILGLQNPSYDVSELRKIRRSPDREALKL